MNYIKIKEKFHTDKWWGKVFFMVLFYFILWMVFYGTWVIIYYFNYSSDGSDFLTFIYGLYIFLLIPFINIKYISKFIKKVFDIKNVTLYILQVFYSLVSIFLFLLIILIIALSHWNPMF